MSRDGLDRIWGFLTPAQREVHLRREREMFERYLVPKAVPWDEAKVKYASQLVIQGETFKPARLFSVEPTTMDVAQRKARTLISPDGRYQYMNMILPRGTSLDLWQGHRQNGKVWFTTDVVIPSLQHGPKSGGHGSAWMSYTPAEVLSMRKGVMMAKGTVVIGGLGMGYLLRQVAAKKSVKKIVVVELSQALLDWFGTKLVAEIQQASGKPIELICGDAKEHVGKHGDDVRYLIDIWDSFPAYVSTEWEKLAQTVEHFWGWGWVKDRNGGY